MADEQNPVVGEQRRQRPQRRRSVARPDMHPHAAEQDEVERAIKGVRRRQTRQAVVQPKDVRLGVTRLRLSPERFGLRLAEIRDTAQAVLTDGRIDYLDMSLWDVFKEPVEEAFKGRSLMSWFTDLDRGNVRLGVAGKITTPAIAAKMLDDGADYVLIGRAAILHHDFPERARDPTFTPIALPVTAEHLQNEGLGPAFVTYMATWPGFVQAA